MISTLIKTGFILTTLVGGLLYSGPSSAQSPVAFLSFDISLDGKANAEFKKELAGIGDKWELSTSIVINGQPAGPGSFVQRAYLSQDQTLQIFDTLSGDMVIRLQSVERINRNRVFQNGRVTSVYGEAAATLYQVMADIALADEGKTITVEGGEEPTYSMSNGDVKCLVDRGLFGTDAPKKACLFRDRLRASVTL